jgi:hypothetical protein
MGGGNVMKITPSKITLYILRGLGLKIDWVTVFVTKNVWKTAVVNTLE